MKKQKKVELGSRFRAYRVWGGSRSKRKQCGLCRDTWAWRLMHLEIRGEGLGVHFFRFQHLLCRLQKLFKKRGE